MVTEPQAQGYSVSTPTPQIITGRAIGIFLYGVLAVAIGVTALLAPALIIIGVVLALFVATLIALYPYFGLLVYYAVVVVQPETLFPAVAALRPPRLISAALLVSTVIHKKYRHEKFIFWQEPITRWFVFFFGALVASVPLSVWTGASVSFLTDFVWTFVYFVLMINLLNTEMRLKGFVWMFLVAGGYNAISSSLAYFSGTLIVAQGIERAEGLAGTDPNSLATTLMLGIPFMLFAVNWIKHYWLKLIPIFFAAMSILTIAITGSRAGVIGLVATGFMLWLVTKKKIAFAVGAVLLLVAGWFALPAQYQERYASIFADKIDASSEGRIHAWEAGVGMFVSNPFTGIGVHVFPVAYASGKYSSHRSWLRPHSMYVQIIAETGLVGLITFGGFIFTILRSNFRLRKQIRESKRPNPLITWLSYSITCSMGALFITAIFAHSLFRGHWYYCAGLTVALLILTRAHLANDGGTSVQSRTTPATAAH